MISRIVYFACCVAYGVIAAYSGIGVTSWQYWTMLACIIISNLCGTFEED